MSPLRRRVSDRTRLRVVQLLLTLLAGAWLVLGPSERFWPIVGWPMYDAPQVAPPGESVSRVFIRVRLRDGTRLVMPQGDLVEYSRAPLAGLSIVAITDKGNPARQAAGRAHLTALVARAIGTRAIDSIAISRTAWLVNPGRVPPTDMSRPVSTVPIAAFAVPQ